MAHEAVLIAVGGLVAWLALLIVLARWHPAGGAVQPASADRESPALVDFLVNRARSTRLGYPATILDLAAHGYLTMTDRSGQPWCAGPRGAVDATRLDPVDAHVLTQVSGRLSGVDGAPFAALAGAQSGVPEEQWWQPFRRLVREQAHERGLSVRRLSPAQALLLIVAAAGVTVLAAIAAGRYSDSAVPGVIWSAVFVFPITVFGVASKEKPTRAARALGRGWLTAKPAYRGELDLSRAAYAVALGLPHPVTGGFTRSAGPTAAWSSLGGTWRLVPVERRPRRIRAMPAFQWVFIVVGTGLVAAVPRLLFPWVVGVLAAGWVLVLVSTGRWLVQLRATPPVVDFDGQLIARWQRQESKGEDTVTVHYGAVDDGRSAWTWVLNSAEQQQAPVGALVHVRADPRKGLLLGLWVQAVPVAPAPLAPVLAANPPPAPAPTDRPRRRR